MSDSKHEGPKSKKHLLFLYDEYDINSGSMQAVNSNDRVSKVLNMMMCSFDVNLMALFFTYH